MWPLRPRGPLTVDERGQGGLGEANLSMVQALQCFPWPRRQSSPSLQEESMKELVLRRSASERKLAKEKKKERKEKALSVHFGEKTPPGKTFSGGIEA